MPWDVSVIGPLNIDLLIVGEGPHSWEQIPHWDGPAEMEMTAAGSVGYTVRNLARLGLKVRVASCVSDDALGTFIEETLRNEGVDTGGVLRVPGTLAGIGVYMLLFGSRKRPLTYRLPTHDPWPANFSSTQADELLDARCLLIGGYLHFKQMWHGQCVDLAREAQKRGLLTVLDPQFPLFDWKRPWLEALADLLPSIGVLFCDEHEALRTTGQSNIDLAAQDLLAAGPKTVIIKKGAQGSNLYRAGYQYQQPAIKLGAVIDTIGAGDAFDAAFTYGLLQGWDLERCSLFASVAAGHTVIGRGGSETMPGVQKIEQIIATLQVHSD
jgi:sugar/nucleoside kinase (ribokinase family)